jgi:hypothetical protein
MNVCFFSRVVSYPRLPPPVRGYVVHALTGKKELATDEWLYQVGQSGNDSEALFYKLRAAKTGTFPNSSISSNMTRVALKAYQDEHPGDAWARRLASRFHAWTPGLSVPLHETADAGAARLDDTPVWKTGDTIDPDVPLMMLGPEEETKDKYRAA